MTKVLILEQSKSVRNNLRERLELQGFSTEGADSPELARRIAERIPFDVVVSDRAEGMNDIGLPLIVLSREGSLDSAVEALRCGAVDFLTKPIDMNRLVTSLRKVTEEVREEEQPANAPRTRCRQRGGVSIEPIVGASPAIEEVRSLIEKVAKSDARVLITGENGTGKELVARWLHAKSARAAAPFVEVNCAAIPSELIESELFGHERGAFTSAIKQRKGKFEQADGGTIFLDEVGDMSLSAQAKVLRALQEHKISRVGSDRDIDVDVRVIAATNKSLQEEIAEGRFREDLYHRLGVILVEVPPLREREGDVALLVDYLLGRVCEGYSMPVKRITDGAVALLSKMRWSGNVRELRNVIERLVVLSDGDITEREVRRWAGGGA